MGRVFLFAPWHSNKLCVFQTIKFYSSLHGNKARTEVLLLPITRARLIYLSLGWYILPDISAKPEYRIGYLLLIKYRLSAITLHSILFRASTSVLVLICLVWLVFAIIFLWRRTTEAFRVKSSEKYRQNLVVYELYIGIGLTSHIDRALSFTHIL